eukprot:6195266-Pleurochrysis_carterae.AAC.2
MEPETAWPSSSELCEKSCSSTYKINASCVLSEQSILSQIKPSPYVNTGKQRRNAQLSEPRTFVLLWLAILQRALPTARDRLGDDSQLKGT